MLSLIPILTILLSSISFTFAAIPTKFSSCSGIYGPQFSNKIKPFINVTLSSSFNHENFNYTTLIFHYIDIKNSNIPDLESFQISDDLKICDEESVQRRECKELGKFIVNYHESESRIYNEVLNFQERSYLEYEVMETGYYCVYVETNDINDDLPRLDQIDVKFQQPYGYLSYTDILQFETSTMIQLPIITILLLGIAGRFIYVKMFIQKEVSLIQKGIFHYTYLVYLKTFVQFLRLWVLNSIDVEQSQSASLISLILITLNDVLDTVTWGLILCISHGFGTLYDKITFPKSIMKKILLFMAFNFLIRISVINNLTSNVQVLHAAGELNSGGSIQLILSIFGFIWTVKSFYNTTKEISMYFDLTTSKLFKKSGLIIFFVPIIMNIFAFSLAVTHLLKKYSDTNIDPIEFVETSWYDSTYIQIMILPNLANFISILCLLYIWDNVDSQKVDEENVAEFNAPNVGEVALNNKDDEE